MKLDRPTLHLIGEALFGPNWQTPLAAELISDISGKPIALRTVQRWAAGDYDVPDTDDLKGQLAALARRRGKVLQQLARELAG